MFDELQEAIRSEVVFTIYHLRVQQPPPPPPPQKAADRIRFDEQRDYDQRHERTADAERGNSQRDPADAGRRQGRTQRPLPVRLRPQVQAVPRGVMLRAPGQ